LMLSSRGRHLTTRQSVRRLNTSGMDYVLAASELRRRCDIHGLDKRKVANMTRGLDIRAHSKRIKTSKGGRIYGVGRMGVKL
jgi:hypothetical protein